MRRLESALFALALVVAACSQSVASPSAAPPTAGPTASPVAVITSAPSVAPTGPIAFPVDGGPLAPGTYAASFAGLSLTLEITAGGWDGFLIPDDGIGFGPTGVQGAVSVTHFDGKVFTEPCSGEKTSTIERSAAAFVARLAANKELKASAPVQTTIGGHAALQVDVTADVPPACPDGPRIWLWVLPTTGDFHLDENESARFIVADIGDHTLVLIEETFEGADQKALLDGAKPILDSMKVN